jgi:hypothetical protein
MKLQVELCRRYEYRSNIFSLLCILKYHVRLVPVPTAWRVLGLRMEERPPGTEVSYEYIE